ncbi:TfoX/Sxy family protein [Aquimarina sp. I32.4]|nr:TfoX/Sxy family protein [Aquimarina sp. I32.4]
MAYSEFIADRIRRILQEQKVHFYEKKMMGGLCFMVDDKMCCGIHYSKKRGMDLLMARIGKEAGKVAMTKEGCESMDFTGRPMKNFVFVTPEGFDLDDDLEYWIQLCLNFNPIAKRSK